MSWHAYQNTTKFPRPLLQTFHDPPTPTYILDLIFYHHHLANQNSHHSWSYHFPSFQLHCLKYTLFCLWYPTNSSWIFKVQSNSVSFIKEMCLFCQMWFHMLWKSVGILYNLRSFYLVFPLILFSPLLHAKFPHDKDNFLYMFLRTAMLLPWVDQWNGLWMKEFSVI